MRNARMFTLMGQTLSMSEWARKYGICVSTLHYRLKHGMLIREALQTRPDRHTARAVKISTDAGELTTRQIAKIAGVAHRTINSRRRDGWPDNALAAPKQYRYTLTAFGKTQSFKAWAEETGLDKGTIAQRLASGWSDEEIVSRPKMAYGEKRWAAQVTAFGKTQTIHKWAKERNISAPLLRYRLRSGMPPEAALTAPIEKRKRVKR